MELGSEKRRRKKERKKQGDQLLLGEAFLLNNCKSKIELVYRDAYKRLSIYAKRRTKERDKR
jgi:hypothetical protein